MNNLIVRITLVCLSLITSMSALAQSTGKHMSGTMSRDMMDGGAMGWPMMLLCAVLVLLVIGLLILAFSAIAKYIRNRKPVN